ncbi:putative phd finger domain-containing protein [Rosellinia necatrix]|uniref:Putative phd finger domain-containing protein n=1 Tax=Rosellinia necatrix TaxID=77044 RepID=A0A1W2TEM4_ROSNE|nr:putative phd finger domain-containing protein [Rosellinia necatrix]
MAAAAEANSGRGRGELDGDVSPRHPAARPRGAASNDLEPISMRADPDASATVTDFLDFTEHLPSDITRSLTLIAQLDSSYIDSSAAVNELATEWGKLPTLPPNERTDPAKLRAAISDKLNHALSSRTYAHAEACRMLEIVSRHYNRIQTILGKLHTMHDNFPTVEEQENKSPVQSKSPQMMRGPKITLRLDGNGDKMRPRRIIVPGEVLGPHEIDFNVYSDSSEDSSEDEISVSPPRRSAPEGPRIKLVKPPPKTPKQQRPPKPSRSARPSGRENGPPPISTSTALAKLKPPPENAVPGSQDAPWLQLTQYELAKLRKRMKKNSQWIPSDTMIARELKNLGRGVEAFKEAQKKAEEEGVPFEPNLPAPVVDSASAEQSRNEIK